MSGDDLFAVGEVVCFALANRTPTRIEFSMRVGVILELRGHEALVRLRNGKRVWVRQIRLTRPGQRNELDRMLDVLTHQPESCDDGEHS